MEQQDELRLTTCLTAKAAFRAVRCGIVDGSGRRRQVKLSGRPFLDGHGRFTGYRGTGSDITAEVETAERAAHLALHDALTGLPNRVLLAEHLEQALSARRRTGETIALLCLDLDHFKQVNDTLGHAAGDELLRQVTARLRDCTRDSDVLARLGGDEFAVLQRQVSAASEVAALGERLIACTAQPFTLEGSQQHIGLSVGAALVAANGDEPAALLRRADIALYRAKAEGRGAFRFFAPEMDERLQARRRLEQELRLALVRDEIVVHYQPQLELGTGRILAVEALARWRHPARGLVPAAEFIPLAEEVGLIRPLGEQVLRQACAWTARHPALRVAVNLSPAQLAVPGVVAMVERVLAETGLAADRLELEITETVLLKDTETVLAILAAFRRLGVGIAMDDFGTGSSSLSYLRRFAFDRIKIDRSFVSSLESSGDAAAIVRAVVGLGRSLGIATLAEGVETERQLAFLKTYCTVSYDVMGRGSAA
jgi:diguanylate cyclase (GGDEF)-like protein